MIVLSLSEDFRKDRTERLTVLARKAVRWAKRPPDMGELIARIADNWRALFAIADAAGGRWPARVREIAKSAVAAMNDESTAALLLTHIK